MSLSVSSHHPLHHHHLRWHHCHLSLLYSKPLFRLLPPQNPKSLRITPRTATVITASANTSSSSNAKSLPNSAIKRIADKLRSLGYVEEPPTNESNSHDSETLPHDPAKIGEIFIPSSQLLPKHRVGHTLDPSWSTPESPVPDPGTGSALVRFHQLRGQIAREKEERDKNGREKVPTLAELSLSPDEMRRLQTEGIRLKKKLKIGKAGVTEGIVNGIHERWKGGAEVVKIVCEDVWKWNMKRTHDLLERKTGGMVVWRAGSKIVLYRGHNYKFPYFTLNGAPSTSPDRVVEDNNSQVSNGRSVSQEANVADLNGASKTELMAQSSLIQGVGSPNRVRFQLPSEKQLLEEAGHVLDGLGPRFTDWWGSEPLPVDADLLPAIVPGYRRPFRLLPYGVKPKLTNDEMTVLKRLGRPLPCHFALGRNRRLQGLAAAMIKLWERCEIAKIAVKRGVQNMNSELMAGELKRLTGGTLISRDKEFIVFYRGKDFLPSTVSSAIQERRELRFRTIQNDTVPSSVKIFLEESAVKPAKSVEIVPSVADDGNVRGVNSGRREIESMEEIAERTHIKLSMALEKKAKAEELLAKFEQTEELRKADVDKEGITEDEKYMLRRVGLRMKPFLLLGRRGVFDGTVENMHLHWKYRELVKIICGERDIDEVRRTARILETESGGILVAVERVRNGFAIIVYRGKNYQRPSRLRPQTLLTKKEALHRSLEAQRHKSLKLNVLKLTRNVERLQQVRDNDRIMLSGVQSDLGSESEPIVPQQLHTKALDSQSSSTNCVDPSMVPSTNESVETVRAPVEDEANLDASNDDDTDDNFTSGESEYSLLKPEKYTHDVAQQYDPTVTVDSDASCLDYMDPSVSNTDQTFCGSSEDKGQYASSMYHDTDGDSTRESESSLDKRDRYLQKFAKEYHTTKVASFGSAVSGMNYGDRSLVHSVSKSGQTASVPLDDKTGQVASNDDTKGHAARSKSQSVGQKQLHLKSYEAPSETLSNKERLILRKQALKMTKSPVLAVGKSNVVTGVAKAIMDHFKKYPFVIVNIKGRAKGTSVQEVVFELQRLSGATLVSREPSKVILYRGWGAGEGPKSANKFKHTEYKSKGTSQLAVSPELISAMRLECGFS